MTTPNYAKQQRYRLAHERLKLAIQHEFYVEAAMICESIITDRLHSHLHWRIIVAGNLSPDVVKQNGLRGRLDFEGHGNLGLLIRILELDFDHLGNARFADLPARLDRWRQSRNSVAHGMVHTSPAKKAYADDFDSFLQKAGDCAREGQPLVGCLTDWDRAVRRRHGKVSHDG